jgi:protein-S-isoprenylcysteine O-methyltransferase Ste14
MSMPLLWVAMTWFWIALEVWVAVATRRRRSEAKVQDRGTQLLLWAVIGLSMTANGFLRHLHLADMHANEDWLKPAALVLLAAGLAVRIVAIATLGKAFSANVATHAEQQLQRSGLYSVVRHPSYLGMEIIFLAIGLHAGDWICLAVVVLLPTLAVLRRIGVEEEALRGLFGEQYAEYCRTTRRLIPGVY